jgi:hypothetical protein
MQCVLFLSEYKQLELHQEVSVNVCDIYFFKALQVGAEFFHAGGQTSMAMQIFACINIAIVFKN